MLQAFFYLVIDLSARVTEISFLGDRLQCFDEVKDVRCLKREVAHDVILQFDCLNSFHNFQKHMTARVPCFAFVLISTCSVRFNGHGVEVCAAFSEI
jgi:hypothetical protein